ncbi:hypothetical protein IWW37_002984 [Coemansia sp. RSA 2050]|nr:hypothetical protein IWW37_002984 [Coemansia sp. RSA 2050]
MSSISRFQQLPKCLLKGICKHVMPIIGNNTGPRPCIAMLRTDLFSSLGSTWREAALEHYFDHFTLAFNSGSGKVNSTHPVEDGFISIEQERHALTSVKVCVALDDLLSGKAAHMLAQSKYSPLVFPSVKTMKIDINEFHRSGWAFDASNVVSTPSLYQQFQTMFPGVKSFAGFNSVCSLIEKLPQLVHLCVAQLDFDYGYDYSCRVHVYNEFTSEWPVLSQQFRCCDVVMESNIEELATFGMLLAVMCPRLTRFMSNSQSRELVQEEIDAAIQEEPFIEHTAKLKLLTYNGIPEGSETFAVKQVYW